MRLLLQPLITRRQPMSHGFVRRRFSAPAVAGHQEAVEAQLEAALDQAIQAVELARVEAEPLAQEPPALALEVVADLVEPASGGGAMHPVERPISSMLSRCARCSRSTLRSRASRLAMASSSARLRHRAGALS